LTFTAYEELGGLEGAIGRRAEEVFQAQSEAVRNELVRLLRALVTVRGTTATARAAALSLFAAGSPRRALADAFLDPRHGFSSATAMTAGRNCALPMRRC